MTEKRFITIHIGTPYEYVIKDINNNETYGMFKGDDKAVITLVNLLNKLNKKKRELKERNQELELENLKYIGEGEWDIRDITCMHGKFRLEEWGERYHQFYEGNKQLEDEEVVSLLFENEQLKHELLCKQLDKAPTYPINCKCYYKELQE